MATIAEAIDAVGTKAAAERQEVLAALGAQRTLIVELRGQLAAGSVVTDEQLAALLAPVDAILTPADTDEEGE